MRSPLPLRRRLRPFRSRPCGRASSTAERSAAARGPAARLALAALAAGASLGHAQAPVQTPGPHARSAAPVNVLFILSDQHTVRALGCYENGFGGLPQSLTPNLDSIAEQGVKFERAYCATPQCKPSRYSLLTGRWPQHHGLRWNTVWEPRDQVTFPELAQRLGYDTATIGKHHMAWLTQPEPLVEDLGFRVVVDLGNYEQYCLSQGAAPYDAPGQFTQMFGVPPNILTVGFTHNANELHPAGYVADRVIEFLERRAPSIGDGKPFVCWFSLDGPHPPVLPSGPADPHDWAHAYHPFDGLGLPPNMDKVATTTKLAALQQAYGHAGDAQWRELLSYYYGLVTQLDWNVGRVLDRLEELGLAGNTLVVYTSDHGEMGSEMSCWTKGAGSYDALTRVPLLAMLPGAIPAGRVVGQPVNAVDLFPTLLEFTGIHATDAERARLDGQSLADLMLDTPAASPPPERAFSVFGTALLPSVLRSRMVHVDDQKYVFDEVNGGEEEFYDLALDPYEIENRIHDPDPVVQAAIASLRAELAAWWGDESSHAPEYKTMNDASSAPVAAADPVPADGALDVDRKVDPRWLSCTAAETRSVHFGTSPDALAFVAELATMESGFNPGTLAPATTYFWRVDEQNAFGTTQGALWTFTTAAGGAGGPGLAAGPIPAHGADEVPLAVTLRWAPPGDASSQEVYLALGDAALELRAAALPGSAAALELAPLDAGVTVRWRVDTTSAEGTTEGTVWTFTTDPSGLPGPATGPIPRHLDAAAVPASVVLRWHAGTSALTHDVYFGPVFPPAFVGNSSGTTYDPGPLAPGQTYYWRVDARNAFGTRPGWTWRFTTPAP